MCGGVTVYTALKRAGIVHGNWVMVTGAGGGLGHLGIQYARAFGARVLVMDSGEKEDFCRSLGAEEFLDFSAYTDDEKLTDEVKRITGGGARVVLMCVSSGRAYAQAVSFLGFRGKLACLGVPSGPKSPIAGAVVEDMIQNEATIFGGRQASVTLECILTNTSS